MINTKISHDRRQSRRVSANLNIVVRGLAKSESFGFAATLIDLSEMGGRIRFGSPLAASFKPKILDAVVGDQTYSVPIALVNHANCGDDLIFQSNNDAARNLFNAVAEIASATTLSDRRQNNRRILSQKKETLENRNLPRRISDLYEREFDFMHAERSVGVEIPFLSREQSYDVISIQRRREWLEKKVSKSLAALNNFIEDPAHYAGNIENLIGNAHVPIGVAGPIRVNGQNAKGNFYVPMATTEGVLVNSYTLGMYLLTRSGGISVRTLADQIFIAPLFAFSNVRESLVFCQWLDSNFKKIKEWAESTTNHGLLIKVEPRIFGRTVAVQFSYSTGDAQGINMVCKATEKACQNIRAIVKPKRFYLRSNYESNKKVSSVNMHNAYGKSLVAEAIVPKALLTVLRTSPDEISDYSQRILLSGVYGGMLGNNAQYANGLAAIFIACGQDAAHVVNSHVGVTSCSVTESGDLYISAHIPNLLVGTIGGGTALATSRACLEIMDCYGSGKVNKFAEIIAATLLAGELSISIAIVNGTYVDAHERFGRNRPS